MKKRQKITKAERKLIDSTANSLNYLAKQTADMPQSKVLQECVSLLKQKDITLFNDIALRLTEVAYNNPDYDDLVSGHIMAIYTMMSVLGIERQIPDDYNC